MIRIRLHLCAALALVAVSGSVPAEDLVVTPLPISPPTATHCTVAKPGPRLTVVLTEDGTIFIHGTEFSADQLTAIASTISKIEPDAKLFLRADKTVATDHVKRVIKACGAGGMNTVIFGSLTDKDHETLNAAKKAVDSTR
ncbi:biopolymer transporter ExbD [Verrucomicrobiales bacterium BCK34]|nr:biopolymer transporter ExbD [Verrucomicrobiales bacterium BCK34]